MSNEYYLDMQDISKTFPGTKVLKEVNFRVKSGEVHALMGENGAGKSTLMKILGGIYSMDAGGVIRIDGVDVTINSVQDAQQHGISIIHQEISMADNMTVADNLFMGREIIGNSRMFLNDRKMVRQAQELLDEMELNIDARERISNLSIAKQQMTEISRALMMKAKIIVMDEPTSSLTKSEIDHLFLQIDKLKKAGVAIIYISHRMDEIFSVCDTVTVLRDGDYIGTEKISNLDQDKIIEMMVGRKLSDVYQRKVTHAGDTSVCMEVKNFKNKYLKGISFTLHKGEVLGFAGLVGAGRTELARAIFGIDKITEGELLVNGKKANIKCAEDAIKLGIGYVPEDRKTEGLCLIHSARTNISISVLDRFIKGIKVNKKYENEIIKKYTDLMSIKMVTADQIVQFLSGGNQQKVVLAKWLATDPEIIIFDEPTRGIDVGAKADIYKLISDLAHQGKAIMLISSEMDEIINLSDRIAVMHEGELMGMIEAKETDEVRQTDIMKLASGGKINE